MKFKNVITVVCFSIASFFIGCGSYMYFGDKTQNSYSALEVKVMQSNLAYKKHIDSLETVRAMNAQCYKEKMEILSRH